MCGKSLRRESLKQHKQSMICKNNFNPCELCGKKFHIKQNINILIQHYVKEQEIEIGIQN